MKTDTYRNTKQRTRILEVLSQTDSHPTASWVYDELKPEFPSLSLGTVYRNLKILEEQGLLNKLHAGSTFDRYDAITHPHAHFVCTNCGALYDIKDFEFPEVIEKVNAQSRHQIEKVSVNYVGLCDKCLEKSKESAK